MSKVCSNPQCGREIQDSAVFCPFCGSQQVADVDLSEEGRMRKELAELQHTVQVQRELLEKKDSEILGLRKIIESFALGTNDTNAPPSQGIVNPTSKNGSKSSKSEGQISTCVERLLTKGDSEIEHSNSERRISSIIAIVFIVLIVIGMVGGC